MDYSLYLNQKLTFKSRNIFIFGARGYTQNYGGWETFVHGLIKNYPAVDHQFFVFEIVHDEKEVGIVQVDGVYCIRVYIAPTSNVAMVLFDKKCTSILWKMAKEYKIPGCIAFYLGPRIGQYIKLKKGKFKKLNIKIAENPAGLEWKRSKWNWAVKKYVIWSAKDMAKAADMLVCDAEAIADVYRKMIGDSPKITFIPYGCYPSDMSKTGNEEVFKQYRVEPNHYYLSIGRFVPENNYEMILEGYLRAKTMDKLVVVANINKEASFYKQIVEKYQNDPRWSNIIFTGAIYDQDKLFALRKNAIAYIHGHSVGGTNPGLLESMSVTDVSYLFDCPFTREVAGDCGFFFKDSKEFVSLLDEKCLSDAKAKDIGVKAKQRMKDKYSWESVTMAYSHVFEELR